MKQNPPLEADILSAQQMKKFLAFCGTRRFITVCAVGRQALIFRNMLSFYVAVLLTSLLSHRLEDHPLAIVCDCLLNMFEPIYRIWRPPLHAPTAMPFPFHILYGKSPV